MRFLTTFALAALAALAPHRPAAARAGDAPAHLLVRLPADAALTIDGEPTRSTSAVRYFVTTPLRPGAEYRYELRANLVRDGKAVTISRRVTVRAGAETATDLYPPAEAAAVAAPASFATPAERRAAPRPAPDGTAGGARDNWKPDESDPFYPWQ